MLKKSFLLSLFVVFMTLVTAFQQPANAAAAGEISVLTLQGDTSAMTQDQLVELQRVETWMNNDIIKQLKHVGYTPTLLKSRADFKGPGHLLIIEVDKFNAGNRAARAFVGFGAGGSSLDLDYQLLNSQNKVVSQWKDGVGSSKGGTYCAQTLNRNTIKKLKIELGSK